MKIFILITLLVIFFLTPAFVLAQPPQQGLNEFLNETELSSVSLPVALARMVRIVLSFLGFIAVMIMVMGGFQWMISGGSEEKIAAAKKFMGAGVVGLLIVVLSYSIASFFLSSINTIVNG